MHTHNHYFAKLGVITPLTNFINVFHFQNLPFFLGLLNILIFKSHNHAVGLLPSTLAMTQEHLVFI
jgi:hypothetical protein